tara:strand:- start:9683 stop:9991 length:309 start_codon:yes stop_codon:yes gene_type:complete
MLGKIAAAAALIITFSLPATAQQQAACAKRTDVLKHLSAKYTEAPVALGLANNGGVLEVLSSKTGTSWTIIITMPNGPTCMVAAGENWEKIPHIASATKQGA